MNAQPTEIVKQAEQNAAQTAVVVGEEKAITKFSNYLGRPEIRQNFVKMMGEREAESFIRSVLTLVLESPKLQQCSHTSLFVAAVRAATLHLSVDPSAGQAYLVPFWDNKSKSFKATLIVGYKGLRHMAVRTNAYTYIPNVTRIYEGEEIAEDRYTGYHSIHGRKVSDRVIGWLGSFELRLDPKSPNRIGKTLYMTCEEIHEHAQYYSKSYSNSDSPWQDPKRIPLMEKKTVLRLLLSRDGYLDPNDVMLLKEIEADAGEEGTGFQQVAAQLQERPAEDDEFVPHIAPAFEGKGNGLSQLGFESVNPDPVKAGTREEWNVLVRRAKRVRVEVQEPDLNTVTDGDLREHMHQILPLIDGAERQAASVAAAT